MPRGVHIGLRPDADLPSLGAVALGPGDALTFVARSEREPGAAWRDRFDEHADAYHAWYLSEGDDARPSLDTCVEMLRRHMPELLAVHERLCELAGGAELDARMLSMYDPPPFITGCSQAAWTGATPVLVRNYDYPASRLEGLLALTQWGERRVMGMSDCLWGLVDGVNDRGLAVSLTFGGSPAVGDGFAISLVLRYVLEVCDTVAEGCAVLARVPVHTAQNVTLLDRHGEVMTALLSPRRPVRFVPTPVATNHQETPAWPEYERAVRSVEREAFLTGLLADPALTLDGLMAAFLAPPLYTAAPPRATGWAGTLYTAAYFPAEGRVALLWPGDRWSESFDDFRRLRRTQSFAVS